ncbi:MAG: TrmH family RNA methyltransferase [Flavobacteriaceae bacterium]|nr:TrmH family RNA methyltransferase [Flavobacteriaceae bacterium]
MNAQHSHESTPFSKKDHRIIVLCDGVTGPANIGSLFRLCDAFGVEKLVFTQAIDLTSPRLRKTARNTFETVPHSIEIDAVSFINQHKNEGYQAVGLEITSNSKPIQSFQGTTDMPLVLVIGSEQNGISELVLNVLDESLHIEMFGVNSSMNVAQAAAIALFELTKT